jgi:predicted XRE-type DNA-binding protein
MKYIKRYESFKNQNSEPVNEEFLGKLIGGIKNLFKKGQERINKTKGGKEIEAVYQKYLKMIHDQLSKSANIDLNIAAASKGEEAKPNLMAAATGSLPGTPATPGAPATPAKESVNYKKSEKVFEADDANAQANAKLAVDTLKKKKTIMDQIVKKLKDQALKEMEAILTKFGGAAANPQLNIIMKTKQDQFEMDYLNAQIAYLDAAGDKTMVSEISKKRDVIMKKIEGEMKEFDTAVAVKYEVGDEVIYLLKDKKPEEYNKTKKPEDQKAIVGVHKIAEIDGDNFTLEDEKGEPTIKKTGKEIMGKVEGAEGEGEYKAGDMVMYLLKNKKKEEFDALTDDEKAKPTEGKAAEIVGVKKIEKAEGDKITFLDKEGKPTILKTLAEIMGKTEAGEKVEGQEDLVKKLGELKTKNPDDIKKVSSYVDFMSDEKNAAKVAEIEKIIGEGGTEAQQ